MLRPSLIAAAMSALALATPAAALAQATETSSLTVTFDVAEAEGYVMIGLYADQAAYDAGTPIRAERVAVRGASGRVVFEGLAPGDYAIKAFHDVDGDGDMGTNPFGLPTEPYAFSNNARGNMGPARWSQARFEVDAAGADQSLDLR